MHEHDMDMALAVWRAHVSVACGVAAQVQFLWALARDQPTAGLFVYMAAMSFVVKVRSAAERIHTCMHTITYMHAYACMQRRTIWFSSGGSGTTCAAHARATRQHEMGA